MSARITIPSESHTTPDGTVRIDSSIAAVHQAILDILRASYAPPRSPALPVFEVHREIDPVGAAPGVFGEVTFEITALGHLDSLRINQSSLSPAVDQSLIDALRLADTTGGFPPLTRSGHPKPLRVYVDVTDGALAPDSAVSLFTIRVPLWRDTSTPTIDPARPIPTVPYPDEALQHGFEGDVIVNFVIDESGTPVPGTFSLYSSQISGPRDLVYVSGGVPYDAFLVAVAQMLRKAHYLPATVAGCPVKALASQPFAFRMRH